MSLSKFATVADYYAHIEQVNAELLEVLEEITDDLECELMARYPAPSRVYPNENRRYERDMVVVRKARAAIAKARGGV